MENFNCLDPDLPLKGKYFLEASAGTGKTFAIEHVICRLIIEGKTPSEILAVTFTRASTRDLKARVFAALQNALKILENEDQSDILYLSTLENREEAKLRLKNALYLSEEMQIFTICSFCYRMLTEYAFEAKIDLALTDPEKEAKSGQMTVSILDTLRSIVDRDIFSPSQLFRLMAPFGRELSPFVKKMVSFLEQDPFIPPLPSYKNLQEKFIKALDGKEEEKISSDFFFLAGHFKKTQKKDGSFHPFVQTQIEAVAKKDFETLIRSTPSIFELFSEKNLKAKTSLPRCKIHYPELLDLLPPILHNASNPALLFLKMGELVKKRFKREEAAHPNYLLEKMFESLSIRSFKESIQKKYSALIIDEFQDTDPLSWSLFKNLFFDTVDLFLVVGDPKQSIYAFRGADLPTFLKAKHSFSTLYALTTNYRSPKSMIDVLNTLFDEKTIPGLFTFQEKDPPLTYHQIAAGKKECIEESAPSVHFPIFQKKENIQHYIAKEILQLKKEGKSFSNMAVLVKDRFVARGLAASLGKASIPVLSNATESITETPLFSLFHLIIEATYFPKKINILKQILIHPLIGFSIDEILVDIENPIIQKWISRFTNWKEILLTQGTHTYLSYLLQDPLLLSAIKNKEAYGDLRQLLSLILDSCESDLLALLDHFLSLNLEEHPEMKKIPLAMGDAVTILTSHMSKGLEFDIVFATGIALRTPAQKDLIKDEKGNHILFNPEDPVSIRVLENLDKEKMRLFYVALTRAKEKLYIFTSIENPGKSPPLGTASPIELYLSRLLSPVFMNYNETYAAIGSLSIENIALALKNRSISHEIVEEVFYEPLLLEESEISLKDSLILKPIENKKRYLSFTALQNGEDPIEKKALEIEENTLPIGAETGQIVHLLFEKIIEEGLYFFGSNEDLQSFVEKELLSTPLFPWREEVYSIIETAFSTPLVKGVSLKEIPPEHTSQELQFLYQTEEEFTYMKGFIDLLFLFEGKYYILDWKMNYLTEYSPASLKAAMEEHNYTLQGKIYKEALKSHLALDKRPFEELFGGTIYFFLRGKQQGIYHLYG
jgi:exodeoxyribonuclease V beta subunit